LTEFVSVSFKESSNKNSSSSLDSTGKTEPQKFSEKVTRKLQSGKRKVLGIASNGRDVGLDSSVEESPSGVKGSTGGKGSDVRKGSIGLKGSDSGKGSDGEKGSVKGPDSGKGSIGVKFTDSGKYPTSMKVVDGVKITENGESVTDGAAVSTLSAIKDGSHSASSSPQRQVKAENRQRALSDTSLHKVSSNYLTDYRLLNR